MAGVQVSGSSSAISQAYEPGARLEAEQLGLTLVLLYEMAAPSGGLTRCITMPAPTLNPRTRASGSCGNYDGSMTTSVRLETVSVLALTASPIF